MDASGLDPRLLAQRHTTPLANPVNRAALIIDGWPLITSRSHAPNRPADIEMIASSKPDLRNLHWRALISTEYCQCLSPLKALQQSSSQLSHSPAGDCLLTRVAWPKVPDRVY